MSLGRDHYNPGKHVPKVVRCNAGRNEAALYKNLGNGQRIKFMWAETVTLGKGGSYEVISAGEYGAGKSVTKPDHYAPGGGFYGKDLDDLHVWATPLTAVSGTIWVDVDTVGDTVTVYSTDALDVGADVDVLFFST